MDILPITKWLKSSLDTNILLFYVRDDDTRKFIEENYAPFDKENQPIISIVTIGEIMVISDSNKWGERKLKLVQKLLDKLVIVEIKYEDIVQNYIEIEQYNRNIHPTKKRKGSHIKMGNPDSYRETYGLPQLQWLLILLYSHRIEILNT